MFPKHMINQLLALQVWNTEKPSQGMLAKDVQFSSCCFNQSLGKKGKSRSSKTWSEREEQRPHYYLISGYLKNKLPKEKGFYIVDEEVLEIVMLLMRIFSACEAH